MAEKTYTYIPAELKSAQVDGIVVSTEGVYDYLLNKNLLEINQDQKELNKNAILWDSESNSFVRYDENGNIINMGDKLTEVVVNNIADEDKEYGHIVAETVVNLIVNNEELGDEITNTVVTNILNEEKNFGNELTENIINNLLLGDEITNYLENNNYITENDLSNYVTQSDLDNSIAGAGKVNDVIIGNTSIVSNKNANIAVEGTYNSSSNKLASMDAVKNIPNNETFINNLKNNNTFNDYITNKVHNESTGGTLTDVKISSDGQNWTSLLGSGDYSTSALLLTKGVYSSSNKLLTDSDVNPSVSGTILTINGKTVNLPTTGGAPGKSAYEIAEDNGFSGTVLEWLASLKGADGTSISIKADANSCTNLGDAYIDNNGNLQVLTTLPSTFTNAGAIRGPKGTSITTIEKTSTSGLVDTYTITLDNGNTETFTVTNGEGGTVAPGEVANAVSNYFSSNPTIDNATINNLTTTTHARTVYEVTASSSSININATNGDILIITLGTSSNPIATVSGIDISNAKVGQNITVILKTAVQGSADILLVNNSFYIWNNKDNEQSSGIVTLTAPQDGYCEISFLCFAKNVTISNTTKDRFYVRGV